MGMLIDLFSRWTGHDQSTGSGTLNLQYAGLALFVLFIVLLKKFNDRHSEVRKLQESQPGSQTPLAVQKPPPSTYEEWQPSDFRRPAATPLLNWNIHTAEPLPYRPFKYGPYHVTMGLRSMPWDDWIELDREYPKFHAEKRRRIAERGDKCCKTAPEAMPAAIELLEELADYLSQRMLLTNHATNETFDLAARPLAQDPMAIIGRLIPEDIALMLPRPPDGQYYLLAGSILLPGFWRLSDKFGMPLHDIHTSGSVPQYTSKLQPGITSLFRRMQPARLVARINYFIQVDDQLGWSSASLGPEDSGTSQADAWNNASTSTSRPDVHVEQLHFRSERQTLRRLPRTGAIAFTIRTYLHPVIEMVAEDAEVARRLASALRSWPADVAHYKGLQRYADVLLPYLDQVSHSSSS